VIGCSKTHAGGHRAEKSREKRVMGGSATPDAADLVTLAV